MDVDGSFSSNFANAVENCHFTVIQGTASPWWAPVQKRNRRSGTTLGGGCDGLWWCWEVLSWHSCRSVTADIQPGTTSPSPTLEAKSLGLGVPWRAGWPQIQRRRDGERKLKRKGHVILGQFMRELNHATVQVRILSKVWKEPKGRTQQGKSPVHVNVCLTDWCSSAGSAAGCNQCSSPDWDVRWR